jgi:ceramide glucosyltransferase
MDALLAGYAVWADAAACTMIWAMLRAPTPPRARTLARRVLVVRPCAGREPHLERTLASSRCLPDASVVFAVRDGDDPAFDVAWRACVELSRSGADARLVITHAHGANRKAAQIAVALEAVATPYDVIVVADADVEIDAETVDALLAALEDERVGAAWASPVETAASTFADRISAAVLDASLHAFPLLAALDARGMVGKLFAVRREALERAGGFSAVADCLGEDMELARRLRACGHDVVAVPAFAASRASGRRLGDVVARYARWIAVVRAQRTPLLAAYPLLIASAPLFVLSAFLLWASGRPLALVACAAVLAVRLAIAVVARRRTRRPLGGRALPLDAFAADVLLLVAWVRALVSRRVVWRGVELRIARDGRLLTTR